MVVAEFRAVRSVSRYHPRDGVVSSYTFRREDGGGVGPFIAIEMLDGFLWEYHKDRPYHSRLSNLHTNFPSATMRFIGSVLLQDGRNIRIAEYIDGDGAELGAFVNESRHIVSFMLWSEDRTTLMENRADFEKVLRSYLPD